MKLTAAPIKPFADLDVMAIDNYHRLMKNPKTGYYQCPRCYGRDVYESKETTGAIAMTLNTPGPVDPTLVNRIESTVQRCRNCGEKANWYDSNETLAYKAKRDRTFNAWFGPPFGLGFVGTAIWFFSDPYDLGLDGWTIALSVFMLLFGAILLISGIDAIMTKMKEKA